MSDNIKQNFASNGRVEWIGLRPDRGEPMKVVEEATVSETAGLEGDRFKGKPGSDRQVTLIQQEHLTIVGQMLGTEPVDPAMTRRNIVVSGINLSALKKHRFQVGDVILQCTGGCPPCSRMEQNLGFGGYTAMIGHGGVTASVVKGGVVRVGDEVSWVTDDSEVAVD